MKRIRTILAFFLLASILLGYNIRSFAENEIRLPANLKCIGEAAFLGDTSIENIIIPKGVVKIEAKAFANTELSRVFIPDTVTFIADDAFENCKKCHIYVNGNNYVYQWATNHNIPVSITENIVKIGLYNLGANDCYVVESYENGVLYGHSINPTIEINGITYDIELIFPDSTPSLVNATTPAEILVSQNVSIVLGSFNSKVPTEEREVLESAGIPTLGITYTEPVLNNENTYFQIGSLGLQQGEVMAKFARNVLRAKHPYCISQFGDDYESELCKNFYTTFGNEDCIYEQCPIGTTDFQTYITCASNQGCDVVFAPVSNEIANKLFTCAKSVGIPFLGIETWDNEAIVNSAVDNQCNIYITTAYQEGVDIEFDCGFKNWKQTPSSPPVNSGGNNSINSVSALGFDAYNIALDGMKNAQSTIPQAIYAALPSVAHNGVTGQITFDQFGNSHRNYLIIKSLNLQTGEWKYETKVTLD